MPSSSPLQTLRTFVYNFFFNSAYAPVVALCGILGDACLTQLIVRFIRYTEIDWETYMYHIELYRNGERNYEKIEGPTGLLVYPAGHVYIHDMLYDFTNGGLNIPKAQQVYAVLYLGTLALAYATYLVARPTNASTQPGEGRMTIPNWLFLVLPLSKRLHSIYVLRLFNDCWAAAAANAAVLALAKGYYVVGTVALSLAISVKMSALLYLPGFVILLSQALSPMHAIGYLSFGALLQSILAYPFLAIHPREYLAGAFDLSRAFLFKWTVNWRFLGAETFSSPVLARVLLGSHVLLLLAFAHFRWCKQEGGVHRVLLRTLREPCSPWRQVDATHAVMVMYTSNLIGIICARSLHYQFYAWYALQIPFLTWYTPYPTEIKIALMAAIEYAWNVFPSTNLSSATLLIANVCLLVGVWFSPLYQDASLPVVKSKKDE